MSTPSDVSSPLGKRKAKAELADQAATKEQKTDARATAPAANPADATAAAAGVMQDDISDTLVYFVKRASFSLAAWQSAAREVRVDVPSDAGTKQIAEAVMGWMCESGTSDDEQEKRFLALFHHLRGFAQKDKEQKTERTSAAAPAAPVVVLRDEDFKRGDRVRLFDAKTGLRVVMRRDRVFLREAHKFPLYNGLRWHVEKDSRMSAEGCLVVENLFVYSESAPEIQEDDDRFVVAKTETETGTDCDLATLRRLFTQDLGVADSVQWERI